MDGKSRWRTKERKGKERRGRRRRGRSEDLDDDKCFLRRNVIYAVIRIVATNLPCRWCIMIATTDHYVHANALHGYPRSWLLQKRLPLLDDCDAHKHSSRRYIGYLLSPYPRVRGLLRVSNLPATNHSGGRFVRVFEDDRSIEPLSKPFPNRTEPIAFPLIDARTWELPVDPMQTLEYS